MTYKQACDSISEVQVAMPSILVLCQSSGKLNGLKNIDDVIHPATAYTYKTFKVHNHCSCDNEKLLNKGQQQHLTLPVVQYLNLAAAKTIQYRPHNIHLYYI